ncbi:DCN1-like protein 5 [Coemansia sp. 'formosensis']|nr:DCN1-like protein 5 [Coemansia sp. 'formosensis']
MESLAAREAWFREYQDFDRTDGKQLIGMEGFERLCTELKLSMEGIEPLVLLWKLGAIELGTVTLEGWDLGIKAMGVGDNATLKGAIDAAVKQFQKDPESYKKFYQSVFYYIKSTEKRVVRVEEAKSVLPVVTNKHWLFMRFIEFLEAQGKAVTSMTRDQWNLLLDLSKSVDAEFSTYSKEEAWPSLFDDFYDWVRENLAPVPKQIDIKCRL